MVAHHNQFNFQIKFTFTHSYVSQHSFKDYYTHLKRKKYEHFKQVGCTVCSDPRGKLRSGVNL